MGDFERYNIGMAKILVIDRKLAYEYDLEKIREPFYIFNSDTFPLEIEEQLESLKNAGFSELRIIGRELYEIINQAIQYSEKKLRFTTVLTEAIKYRSKWKWGVIYNFPPRGD
jgi:hypothetical protein